MSFKIEVGKTYKDSSGLSVEIVYKRVGNDAGKFKFIGVLDGKIPAYYNERGVSPEYHNIQPPEEYKYFCVWSKNDGVYTSITMNTLEDLKNWLGPKFEPENVIFHQINTRTLEISTVCGWGSKDIKG